MAPLSQPTATTNAPAPLRLVGLDRRRWERFEAIGPATLRCADRDDAGDAALTLLDESAGGLGVVSDDDFAPGQRVTVRVGAAGNPWRTARVVACTAHRRGRRLGLAYEPA